MTVPTCAITGTSGTVGRALVAHLPRAGWRVAAIDRAAYDLRRPLDLPPLGGLDALVLNAWDFSVHGLAEERRVNVRGSLALLEAALAAGVPRIVLVSTLSAREGTPSCYGQAKREVERAVLNAGGTVLRPGLIWGTPGRGLVATLARVATALPVVPVVGARERLWLCRGDDLARAVAGALALTRPPAQPLPCAHHEAVAFQEILRRLAAAEGKKPLLVPVPLPVAAWPLALAEQLGLRARIRSDGLRGLFGGDPRPDFAATQALGWEFQPFAPGKFP